jgi:hypothetical protein
MQQTISIVKAVGRTLDVPVTGAQISGINPLLLGVVALALAAIGGGFVYTVYSVIPMGKKITATFMATTAVALSAALTSLGMKVFQLTFPERVRVLQAAAIGVIVGAGYTAVRYRPATRHETGDNDPEDGSDGGDGDGDATDWDLRATSDLPEVSDLD